MNTIGTRSALVTPEFWEGQEMRDALLKREISAVYRLLRKHGISQRQIAAATGQSQSEVSEILKGRQVMAYDVLVRIADGLRVPRGFMGLAYDEGTAIKVVGVTGDSKSEEDETVKRRKFLAHAAAVTVGAAVFGEDEVWAPTSDQTPVPGRIGVTDVRQIEAATSALRSLDSRHGGGFCRDAVIAQLRWAQQLLSAQRRDGIENRLFVAIGDLHNLAGWTSFDTGLIDSARGHFSRALEFARRGGDDSLVANVLYRTGRLYLHHDEPNEALKLFQLGQMAAQNTGSQLTTAVLCANEAWAYAKMGMERPAKNLVNMAKDMFERSERSDPPGWVRFFDETDLFAMIGAIHTELATKDDADPKHSRIAINSLNRAISDYQAVGGAPTRNVAFQCTMLALNHLIEGDTDQSSQMGSLALDASEHVRSKRVFDRMKPLEDLAQKRSANPMSKELAERIRSHRVA